MSEPWAWAAAGAAAVAVLALRQRELLRSVLPEIQAAFQRQPDRLRLQRVEKPEWKRAQTIEEMTRALAGEGFEDAGTFSVDAMPGVQVRLLAKPEDLMMACVYEHPRVGAWAELVTRYEDGSAATATTLPDMGVPRPPWLKSFRFPDASAAELARRLASERPAGAMKRVSAADAPGEFERGYAEHMAWMKNRSLDLNDVRRMAERRVEEAAEGTPLLTALRARVRRSQRRRWVLPFLLPVSLIAFAMGFGCLVLARDARALRLRGRTTVAAVDATRRVWVGGDEERQVRYHFQLEPGGPVYSARGLFHEPDAWAGLQFPAFDEAEKTRTVLVVYDPADPWNHGLVKSPGFAGITDSPWFFGLGALPFLAVGLFSLVFCLAVL